MPRPKYRVSWTETAVGDLEDITVYIAVDSVGDALDVLAAIKEKAGTLLSFPERGRIVPDLKFHNIETYRELIINPWRILYRIHENNVYVLAVLDCRRNIEEVLLERFLRRNL